MTGRPPSRTLAWLLPLLAAGVLVLLFTPSLARANPLRLDQLTAAPGKVAADGGLTTITVRASDIAALGEAITLTTTRGAFGATAGPTRVVLTVRPDATGGAVASAPLVGDGVPGIAIVTARSGGEERSVTVIFVGRPSTVSFDAPASGLLSAALSHALTVQVRDRMDVTVPDTAVTLGTSAGMLTGAGQSGALITVVTDSTGRARARLSAPPGPVRLTARAGAAFAERAATLYGAPASLRLISLRSTVNLGDTPFAAPPSTLVAVVQDVAGQPVPDLAVVFVTDLAGVEVVLDDPAAGARTDAGGAVRGHVSAAGVTTPGIVTVTARSGLLEDRIDVRIVAPPSQILLTLAELGGGAFELRATVQDPSGFAVATGFEIDWEALNVVPGGGVSFDPPRSLVRNGTAETVVTTQDIPPGSVTVRAILVDSDPPLTVAAILPAPLPQVGTLLQAGLNVLTWVGPTGSISQVVEPIARLVIAAWRLDLGAGWQAYFPTAGLGQDFLIANGDTVYVFVAAAVRLPDVEFVQPAGDGS